jgi:hypothetical protein
VNDPQNAPWHVCDEQTPLMHVPHGQLALFTHGVPPTHTQEPLTQLSPGPQHTVPQNAALLGHAHVPLTQTCGAVQTCPHAPQLFTSVARFVHVPAHSVGAVAGHSHMHVFGLNTCPSVHVVDVHLPLQHTWSNAEQHTVPHSGG